MTPTALQKELSEEIEKILKDIIFKTPDGGMEKIRIYGQRLPKKMQEIADCNEIIPWNDDKPYPFCCIKLDSGELRAIEGTHKIKTELVFGIFDDDEKCQGDQVILTMIQRISERFSKNPVLNGKFRMNLKEGIGWVLDPDDRYPFYFGAMEMTWDTFFVKGEEDRYA